MKQSMNNAWWMGCQRSWEAYSSATGLLEELDGVQIPWDIMSLLKVCKVGGRKVTLHSEIILLLWP